MWMGYMNNKSDLFYVLAQDRNDGGLKDIAFPPFFGYRIPQAYIL